MPDDKRAIADEIARRFDSRFVQGYVRGKIRSDPVYPAVVERLVGSSSPILDVGCGVGLLGHYIRARGLPQQVVGIDFDQRKIEAGEKAAGGLSGISFRNGDARERIEFQGNVVMLDLLHYFRDDEQKQILSNAADYARPGDVVVIRDCLREKSWRYRLTWLEEAFATSIGWLRGERLNFPTRESIVDEFRRRGFEDEVIPLWGGTPFNNYLLTFRCL